MVVIQDHGRVWLLQSELASAATFSLGGVEGLVYCPLWGELLSIRKEERSCPGQTAV